MIFKEFFVSVWVYIIGINIYSTIHIYFIYVKSLFPPLLCAQVYSLCHGFFLTLQCRGLLAYRGVFFKVMQRKGAYSAATMSSSKIFIRKMPHCTCASPHLTFTFPEARAGASISLVSIVCPKS